MLMEALRWTGKAKKPYSSCSVCAREGTPACSTVSEGVAGARTLMVTWLGLGLGLGSG